MLYLARDASTQGRFAFFRCQPAFGARPLKRVILKNLQDPMAQAMLEGGYGPGDTIEEGVDGEVFTFEKTKP